MVICQSEMADKRSYVELAGILWPDAGMEELEAEFDRIISNSDQAILFIRYAEKPVAFIHCSIRRDYVEGSKGSPVAYIEGIFVRPDFREKGLGRMLVAGCASWAAAKGSRQIASDCELLNEGSIEFHKKVGFSEVNRKVCFIRSL